MLEAISQSVERRKVIESRFNSRTGCQFDFRTVNALGKNVSRIFTIGAKRSVRSNDPAWQRTCKKKPRGA